MSEIPKFVQSRLGRTAPGTHPDPDVLTAFVERALPERERTQVLDHLAVCPDCRDVVVLAQPESVAETQTVLEREKKGLPRWPILRWVAVAACLVVGGSIALQVLRAPKLAHMSVAKQTEGPPSAQVANESATAREEATADRAANEPASTPSGEKLAYSAPTTSSAGTLARKMPLRQESKVASLDRKADFRGYSQQKLPPPSDALAKRAAPAELGLRADRDQDARYQGYSNAMVMPPGGAAGKEVAAAPPASPSQEVAVTGRLAEAEADTRTRDFAKAKSEIAAKKAESIASNKPDATGDYAFSGLKDDRQKAPTDAATVAGAPAKAQATPATAPAHASETVEVTAASPAVETRSGSLSELQTTAMQRAPSILPRWRLAKDRRLQRADATEPKWQNVTLEGQPDLHALFFSGPHVWVGGKDGVLFHSADAGEHWQRVTASHDGAMLTDDVVAIDFKDFQHGQLKTGKKEVWISSDGGQTWAPK